MFRNGSTPVSVRDWQSLVTGVLARSLDLQDVHLGKLALGRVPVPGGGSYSRDKQLVALVDLEDELAQMVLQRLAPPHQLEGRPHDDELKQEQQYELPVGIKMAACVHLPELVVDRTERDFGRGGSSRGRGEYRAGGSGGYGDAGRARFGGGRAFSGGGKGGSGSSGRAWGGGSANSRGTGGKSWQQR